MIEGAGNIGVEFGPNGVVVADNSRSPRLFKIVSGANPYTANEVALIEADGSKLLTGNYEVTAAQKVLWEVNGNTSVPADTIVEATPNPFGGGFYFSSAPQNTLTALNDALGGLSDVAVTAATGVYQTILTSQTFTTGGTYLVFYHVSVLYNTNTPGDHMKAIIATSTGDFLGSVTYPASIQVSGVTVRGSSSACFLTTIAASTSLTLKVARVFGGTVTTSNVSTVAGSGGTTRICALLIS